MTARPLFSCPVSLTLNNQPAKAMWRPDRQTYTAIAGSDVIGQKPGELLTLAALEQQLAHRNLHPTPQAVAALVHLGITVAQRHGTAHIVGTKNPEATMTIVTPDNHVIALDGHWDWGPDTNTTATARTIIQAAFAADTEVPNIDDLAAAFAAGTLDAIEDQWAIDLNHVAHFARTGQPPRVHLENNATRTVEQTRTTPKRTPPSVGR